MSEPLLAFKAGRAFRRDGSNVVEPNPTKGAVILTNAEDGLLHFTWRNRETNEVEEVCSTDAASSLSLSEPWRNQDLILFPSDAAFVKVTGRTYVLKFSSSNQRHFVCALMALRPFIYSYRSTVLVTGTESRLVSA